MGGSRKWKKQLQKNQQKQLSYQVCFSDDEPKIRNALYCFPEDLHHFQVASYIFFPVLLSFHSFSFQLLVKNDLNRFCREFNPVSIVTYREEDCSPSEGIPLLSRIRLKQFDSIIDLNIKPVPHLYALIQNIHAPLKIGFKNQYSHLCYNIEIERKEETCIETSYLLIRQLLNC